jgi:pSer/pThr/pTyr-binding forkhead associated (FHA) protein
MYQYQMTSDKENIPNAFLILENQVFPINRTTTNIGRRLTNHLVIDDKRISRQHAQIRVINEQHYIVDLNSTGGTFVNGERITQSMLFPSDSISLAGYRMTFVLETGSLIDRSEDYTTPEEPIKEDEITEPKDNSA